MIETELHDYYTSLTIDPATRNRVFDAVLAPRPRRSRAPLAAVGVSIAAVAAVAIGVTQLHGGTSGRSGPAAAAAPPKPAAATSFPRAFTIAIPDGYALYSTSAEGASAPGVVYRLPAGDLAMIKAALPGTSTSGTAALHANVVTGGFVYDDGHGQARIEFSVTFPSSSPKDAVPAGCTSAPKPGADCTTLPDGTQLDLSTGEDHGTAEWDASAYLINDVQIQLSEWNAATPTGSPTRTDPPLTLAQMQGLVLDCGWVSCPAGTYPSTATAASTPAH